jgi:hypothetical protein
MNKNKQQKRGQLVVLLVLFTLCSSGCALLRDVIEPDAPPTPTITPMPTNGVTVAQRVLAQQLGIPVTDVVVISAETAEWPDSCLGLQVEDQRCAQVITPGYRVTLEAQGSRYLFHTNETGGNVRLAPEVAPAPPPVPTAVTAAQQGLAQQLGLEPTAVTVVSADPVEWPDSCLGATLSDEVCAQVVTPGYQIILEAQGQQYQYHTDESGGAIRLAGAPEPQIGQPVLGWSSTEGGLCQEATIGTTGIAFGPCGGALLSGRFIAEERLADLAHFATTYAPFQAITQAGGTNLAGQGTAQPTSAEQRAVAEWARQVVQEAATGQNLAVQSAAFLLRREGGLAGFCEETAVSLSGSVLVTSCRPEQMAVLGQTRLNANQLAALYTWVDLFQGVEWLESDPATADALTSRLSFNGRGALPPTERERQAMLALLAQLNLGRSP